jgi:FMN phosphatase YigB (HAD superfamily)
MATERAKREAAGQGEELTDEDLYPDVRPALKALRDGGLWVGIAGNQTARAAELLRGLALSVDAIATSGEWGAAKPDQAFFNQLIQWVPADASEIVYVGDHRDNNVIPASSSGLRTAMIRRGPWGHLWPTTRLSQILQIGVLMTLVSFPSFSLASDLSMLTGVHN